MQTLFGLMYPPLGEARLFRHVALWLDGVHRSPPSPDCARPWHLNACIWLQPLPFCMRQPRAWQCQLLVCAPLVDPHWRRGISYLKIGWRWLQGVLHKGRELLTPIPLLPKDPQPAFASKRALARVL